MKDILQKNRSITGHVSNEKGLFNLKLDIGFITKETMSGCSTGQYEKLSFDKTMLLRQTGSGMMKYYY